MADETRDETRWSLSKRPFLDPIRRYASADAAPATIPNGSKTYRNENGDVEHEIVGAPEQVKVVFPIVLLTGVQVPRESGGGKGQSTTPFGETR